jgi:hypothetical protein
MAGVMIGVRPVCLEFDRLAGLVPLPYSFHRRLPSVLPALTGIGSTVKVNVETIYFP